MFTDYILNDIIFKLIILLYYNEFIDIKHSCFNTKIIVYVHHINSDVHLISEPSDKTMYQKLIILPYFYYLLPLTYSRKNAPCKVYKFLTARIFMNMAHVPPRFYNQHQQLMADAANKTSAPPPAASAAKRVGLIDSFEFKNVRKVWAPDNDNDLQVPGKRRGESQLSQGNSQGESQGYSQGPFTQVPLHIICLIKTFEDETRLPILK